MHLFFVDLFTDIDVMAPVIFKLSKKKEKVIICSTNIIQSNKNNKFIKYFIQEGIEYHNFPKKNLKFIIFRFVIFILNFFPKIILKKLRFFFKYFYKNHCLFSENEIINFIKKKNISSVTIDSSNPLNKIRKIYLACRKINIKMIILPTGTNTLLHDIHTNNNDLKYCDYYLCHNSLENFKLNTLNKKKVKILGSPRFSKYWLNVLEDKFNIKKFNDDVESKKIKLGIFLTPNTQNFPIYHTLIKKLKTNKNIIIKFRNKPRDYVPEKICDYEKDEYSSSDLINWSDCVISVQSSIILECIQKNKLVFFLNYLIPKDFGSWDSKYNCVDLIQNELDFFSKIDLLIKNKYNFTYKNKNEYLEKTIGFEDETNNVLKRFLLFYKSIC